MELSRTALPATIERLQGEISRVDENGLIGLMHIAHIGEDLLTTLQAREHIKRYTSAEGNPPRAALLVARIAFNSYMGDEPETVGFAAATFNSDERQATVDHLFVNPRARSHNIGRALLARTIEFARLHEAETLAYTYSDRRSAEEEVLLQKTGFLHTLEHTPVLYLTP